MTPPRQRMITAMQMHGYSPRTHQSYLAAVRGLAKHTHRSPDSLSREDLRGYFQYLITERHLAPASVRLSYNGIRFLYLQVLDWNTLDLEVLLPKRVLFPTLFRSDLPDLSHPDTVAVSHIRVRAEHAGDFPLTTQCSPWLPGGMSPHWNRQRTLATSTIYIYCPKDATVPRTPSS